LAPSPELWGSIQAAIDVARQERSSRPFSRIRQWLIATLHAPRLSPALAVAMVVAAVVVTVVVMRYSVRVKVDSGPIASGPGTRVNPPGVLPGSSDRPDSDITRPPGIAKPVSRPPERRGGSRTKPAFRPSSAPDAASPEQLVREAEQKYLSAIDLLTRDVDRNRSSLTPGERARFESALKSIDQTIAETRSAVRNHPSDPVAVQYMLAAYSEKVEVLREMAGSD
ncbi:MAG TPA: hypothetical protein VJX67_17810, partial [Blastocatellia bacterium]|nr:hypothetical protein [Blastocatellia bacterium]